MVSLGPFPPPPLPTLRPSFGSIGTAQLCSRTASRRHAGSHCKGLGRGGGRGRAGIVRLPPRGGRGPGCAHRGAGVRAQPRPRLLLALAAPPPSLRRRRCPGAGSRGCGGRRRGGAGRRAGHWARSRREARGRRRRRRREGGSGGLEAGSRSTKGPPELRPEVSGRRACPACPLAAFSLLVPPRFRARAEGPRAGPRRHPPGWHLGRSLLLKSVRGGLCISPLQSFLPGTAPTRWAALRRPVWGDAGPRFLFLAVSRASGSKVESVHPQSRARTSGAGVIDARGGRAGSAAHLLLFPLRPGRARAAAVPTLAAVAPWQVTGSLTPGPGASRCRTPLKPASDLL